MRLEKEIGLAHIIMDRLRINPKALKYANLIDSGVQFPPIKVALCDDGRFEIRDGRHRYTAHKLLGREKILAKYSTKRLQKCEIFAQ